MNFRMGFKEVAKDIFPLAHAQTVKEMIWVEGATWFFILFVNLDYFGKFTSCSISIVMFCMIFNNPVLL